MPRVAAVLLCLLGALAFAAPAPAVESTGAIARALERSPLYVDPSFDDDVLPAAQRRSILAAIGDQDGPVYVAVVALRDGDRFGGDESAFLSALQARVDDTEAAFVAFSEYSPRTSSSDAAVERRLDRASEVVRVGSEYDTPVGTQLLRLLEAYGDPDLAARYEEAMRQEAAEVEASATPTVAPSDADEGDDEAAGGSGVPLWLVIVGGILILAVFVGMLAGRYRAPRPGRGRGGGAPTPAAAPLLPDRVFENARRARTEELAERTRTEVVALANAIDTAPTPSGGAALAAYERAVDAAAAASKLHADATRIVEFAGALVLVDDGRDALAEAADLDAGRRHTPGRAPCFFDPLHGRSARDVRWAVREVAACADCAQAVRAGREPDVLREDGTPWFERDGALAETGMNQFAPLAPRIARGDRA